MMHHDSIQICNFKIQPWIIDTNDNISNHHLFQSGCAQFIYFFSPNAECSKIYKVLFSPPVPVPNMTWKCKMAADVVFLVVAGVNSLYRGKGGEGYCSNSCVSVLKYWKYYDCSKKQKICSLRMRKDRVIISLFSIRILI